MEARESWTERDERDRRENQKQGREKEKKAYSPPVAFMKTSSDLFSTQDMQAQVKEPNNAWI